MLCISFLGWYDIPDGTVFSFPVTMHPKGYWNVVQDLELTEEMKTSIKATLQVKMVNKLVTGNKGLIISLLWILESRYDTQVDMERACNNL